MQQEAQHKTYQNYNNLKQNKMKYKMKDIAINLTHKPKFMYPLFNLFQLQLNRFHNLSEFSKLAQEIIEFNQELQNWKKNSIEIKNLLITYHLYQNLFSRMKYTSSLVIDRIQAKRAYIQIAKWFALEKPKIRNKVPQKQEGKLKPSLSQRGAENQIDSLLVTNNNKRQLKVYQCMARTSHKQFFPPKQRLLDYKRKQLLQGLNTQLTQRRAVSVTTFTKGTKVNHKYKPSLGTTKASFFKTATQNLTSKQDEKIEPIVVPFELSQSKQPLNQNIQDPIAEDLLKQKQVQQEQILQKNIVKILHEQDQIQGQEDVFSQQQAKDNKKFRKYKEDPNAQAEMIAEQQIKDPKQSTIRRILKQKQEAVRIKLEQLSIAQQMGNWAAVKARQNSEQHRKLERMSLANKFKKLQYIPKTFEERQSIRKREIPEFQHLYRSRSSTSCTIEQEVEKLRINNVLRTYSKYINHIQIKPIIRQTQEQQSQMKIMRATSLTSFCRQGKRTPFSSLIQKYGVQSYNEQGFNYMITVKDRLAKTAIPVQKREIINALTVANMDKMDRLAAKQIYPPKKTLLNNPFFPKNLYQNKPKKKKT